MAANCKTKWSNNSRSKLVEFSPQKMPIGKSGKRAKPERNEINPKLMRAGSELLLVVSMALIYNRRCKRAILKLGDI